MNDRTIAARIALRAALQLRRSLSIPRELPVNVFDIAGAIGIDVRFLDLSSLEGMFCRDPGPRILLPSLKHRPRGRVAFSCAHELGHFALNHDTRFDECPGTAPQYGPKSSEEFAADAFAGSLLMPRQAVLSSFARRRWISDTATPLQLFIVAGEMGVGYETLLTHLSVVLGLLPSARIEDCRRIAPKTIRSDFLQDEDSGDLVIIDEAWAPVPVDLQIGDLIALSSAPTARFLLLEPVSDRGDWNIFRAHRSGIEDVVIGERTITVRVARYGYVGPVRNRFLEDPDER